MVHPLRAIFLAWLVLDAPVALVAPAVPVDGKADFDASFAQVRGLMDRRKWKEARTSLQDLLTAHKDQDYVRARLPEIKDRLGQCSFEIAFPRKQVKDVFLAQKVAWDEKKGVIELVYERPKPSAKKAEEPKEGATAKDFPSSDFQKAEGLRFKAVLNSYGEFQHHDQGPIEVCVHELLFTGSCSIEVSGVGLGQGEPGLRVGIQGKSCLEASFPPGNAPKIVQIKEGEKDPKYLAMQTEMINAALPYSIEVRADETKIEGWYNDKRIISAKRSAGVLGQVGFCDVEGVRKIRIAGKVDPAWIEKRVAELVKADRDAFDKTYDVKNDLPEWLR